jgi:hypothetical protein
MDDQTNQEAPEVEEVEFEEQEAEVTEEDGEAEAEAPETVEIEINGKTYTVPVDLKDGYLMQADYTRKTQEIAETRKALDSQIERVQQAGEAEVSARAQVIAIEAALGQYQDVDWDLLESQDPAAAQRHFRQFMQLQNGLEGARNEYQGAVERRTLETQHEAAKRIEQGTAELQRDLPGWGPELATQLVSFGESMGLSRDYMDRVDDPALVKLMHMAFVAAKGAKKPATPKVADVKPAAKVKGGSQPPVGLDDRLSADEWTRRRNAQVNR